MLFFGIYAIEPLDEYEDAPAVINRVIENIKNKKIYKKDFESIITYAKYLQSNHEELANEFYTLCINGNINDNYDEFYSNIEGLKSETNNAVETIRKLKH